MSYFAELDSSNTILRVIFIDAPGVGVEYCEELFGGIWKQISYNTNFPARYPSVNYTYNAELDVFIPPKPFSSWLLDTETAYWVPPIPAPSPEYTWNEEIGAWE